MITDKPTTNKFLKDHIYYNELYDSFTIKKCLYWDNRKNDCEKKLKIEKNLKKKEKLLAERLAIDLLLYIEKGERYLGKDETVQEWMDSDKVKDEKMENAVEPGGVRCLKCSSRDMSCTSRDLMSSSNGKEEVLFMFQCDKCDKRRSYWENGKEWERKSHLCPKCSAEVQHTTSRKGEIIITIYSCSQCGNEEKDVFDTTVKEEPIDPDFEMNRKKYCMSEKEGMEYVSQKEGMKEIQRMMDDVEERKKNKALYDTIAKIKKLTVFELQKLLDPILKKAGYVKLEFEKPDLQKDVILGFGLQDAKSSRFEYDSVHDLQKLLKDSLKTTNWRLMSDGVRYRLGFLQGRLRGIEGEDNLKGLIEKEFKQVNNHAK
jgi:hypothetical protein